MRAFTAASSSTGDNSGGRGNRDGDGVLAPPAAGFGQKGKAWVPEALCMSKNQGNEINFKNKLETNRVLGRSQHYGNCLSTAPGTRSGIYKYEWRSFQTFRATGRALNHQISGRREDVETCLQDRIY